MDLVPTACMESLLRLRVRIVEVVNDVDSGVRSEASNTLSLLSPLLLRERIPLLIVLLIYELCSLVRPLTVDAEFA